MSINIPTIPKKKGKKGAFMKILNYYQFVLFLTEQA